MRDVFKQVKQTAERTYPITEEWMQNMQVDAIYKLDKS